MLHVIKSLDDPYINYIKDDPVRPEIPLEFRISPTTEILVLEKDKKPKAIVCVAYRDIVPSNINELMIESSECSVAVFYTIWSYEPGAGRDIIVEARKLLPKSRPSLQKFVTLSPQTEMARKFHLKNGAFILRENANSVNFEYA